MSAPHPRRGCRSSSRRRRRFATIRRTVEHLARQSAHDALELVVVVPSLASFDADAALLRRVRAGRGGRGRHGRVDRFRERRRRGTCERAGRRARRGPCVRRSRLGGGADRRARGTVGRGRAVRAQRQPRHGGEPRRPLDRLRAVDRPRRGGRACVPAGTQHELQARRARRVRRAARRRCWTPRRSCTGTCAPAGIACGTSRAPRSRTRISRCGDPGCRRSSTTDACSRAYARATCRSPGAWSTRSAAAHSAAAPRAAVARRPRALGDPLDRFGCLHALVAGLAMDGLGPDGRVRDRRGRAGERVSTYEFRRYRHVRPDERPGLWPA